MFPISLKRFEKQGQPTVVPKNRVRHSFPRMTQLYSLVPFFVALFFYCVKGASDFKVPKPTKTQAKWLDYEVGAIVHFNMQTFDGYMKPGKSQHIWFNKRRRRDQIRMPFRFPIILSVKNTLNSNERDEMTKNCLDIEVWRWWCHQTFCIAWSFYFNTQQLCFRMPHWIVNSKTFGFPWVKCETLQSITPWPPTTLPDCSVFSRNLGREMERGFLRREEFVTRKGYVTQVLFFLEIQSLQSSPIASPLSVEWLRVFGKCV